MGDKTGMEALIPVVECLYLDYLAFRQIARSAEPEKWAVHLNAFRKAKRSQISPQFDAILAILRSTSQSAAESYDAAAQQAADLLLEGML